MHQEGHPSDEASERVHDEPDPWAVREDACAGTLDRISELQKQICSKQDEQIRLLAAYVEQRNMLDADLGVPSGPAQYRCLVAEVAIACNVSNLSAQSFLAAKVRALVEQRVIEIDPDAAARRATQERAHRHVSIASGTPGTAHLNASLPVEQATACWHALHDQARGLRADGDPRSISHLMCDTLVERLTGVNKSS
jgi:hypothetical protein